MNFHSNCNIKIENNKVNSLKLSKSILESINIIYDDDFISLINKLAMVINENYKFINQTIIKLQNISNDINNQLSVKNSYTNELNKFNIHNKSKFWQNINSSLNHNIGLINFILNRFFENTQNLFKKMKLIRNQKMKNIIDFVKTFNYSKINNNQYFSNRNDKNIKDINLKGFKTLKNMHNNFLNNNNDIELKSKSNNKKIKYYNESNSLNLNGPISEKTNKIINKNNSQDNIINKNSDLTKIKFNNINSDINIKNSVNNNNNNKKNNNLYYMKEHDLIKLDKLKNDLINLSSEIIKNEKCNKNNYINNLNIKMKIIKEEKQKLLNQIIDKEKSYQNNVNIIKNDKNNNFEKKYIQMGKQNSNIKSIDKINQNENKLMENLIKEMNKKNNEINQLKNKINILDISLDSSLIKNKELNIFINLLKTGLDKLKADIGTINQNNLEIYNKLIIEHNINLFFFGKYGYTFKEQKFSLKDYILITDKNYKNMRWFLLKNKNNNSNNYKDYIWVDSQHLIEKEKNVNEEENKLFKFLYHNHNFKNKHYKYKEKNNISLLNNEKDNYNDNSFGYKEEINNDHSLLISNVINNQFFIFNNYKNHKNKDDIKSYSFNRKSDNNIYQKLINNNKLEKNETNDFKKLDNLAISNIYQENNEEENSLINDIRNINNINNINNDNNPINILKQNNNIQENKILNDEAFMKTYNSTELELEAAKNQLVFIKNELRDLKHRFDVVKYSFINLFGKINFPKKYKIEITQILKLLGVDDNKISFIFDYK